MSAMHFDSLAKEVSLSFLPYLAYLESLPKEKRVLDLNNSMTASFVGHLMRIPKFNIYNYFFTTTQFQDFSRSDVDSFNELHQEASTMIPTTYAAVWNQARRVAYWSDFGFSDMSLILDTSFYTNFLRASTKLVRSKEATYLDDLLLAGFYEKGRRESYVTSCNVEHRNLTELMPESVDLKFELVDSYRRNQVRFNMFIRVADGAQISTCWDLRSPTPTLVNYL